MFLRLSRTLATNGRSLVGYSSSPTVRALPTVLARKGPGPFPRESLADTQWRGLALSVSAGSARRPKEDPELTSPAHQSGRDQRTPDGEDSDWLSTEFVSRRSFRKTSPALRDMSYRDEEEDPLPFRSRTGRRNTPYWYFLQCKKLIKQKRLGAALSLFQEDMLRGEGLEPAEFNYTVLIGGCGRHGHIKQAFRLYNNMKKRGLVPTDHTYTALFNACAESPWRQAGLQQALKLEEELRRTKVPLNTITYHALLKTHALTNDLRSCLHTLKEMVQNGHAVTCETFHYLLMGCVTDKKQGFRLALQVWRQMLRTGIRPDHRNYNLLLRAARDCGIGNPVLASSLLLDQEGRGQEAPWSEAEQRGGASLDVDLLESQLFLEPGSHGNPGDGATVATATPGIDEPRGRRNSTLLLADGGETEAAIGPPTCQSQTPSATPNLLDLSVGQSGVVSLGTVSGASDRLALMGGARGLLEKMATDGICPDIKTLSLLADTMTPGSQSLRSLLQVAKQHRVKLDAAFFNSAIRRMARRGDLEGAKEVVSVMSQRGVSVDMQTYGSLALGCDHRKDGMQLLADMEGAGLQPSLHVFSALIGRAGHRLDYAYLKDLLKSMKSLGVAPNDVIITQLEFASQYPPHYDQYKTRNNYLIQIDGFRGYYQEWLTSMPAQETPRPSPWTEGELEGELEGDQGRRPGRDRGRRGEEQTGQEDEGAERDPHRAARGNQDAAAQRVKTARRNKQPTVVKWAD